VVERCKSAEIVITNKTPLSHDTISKLPQLKYIGVIATGYNIVDVEAAKERGIPVSNIPTYGTKSVAQMAMAHILELTNQVGYHAQTVREGKWERADDWCYWDRPLIELDGLTIGIIGFGRIGQATGELASAFGMKVLAHDPVIPDELPTYVKMVERDEIFRESDIVSLHCPLTEENNEFVDRGMINLMKPTAFLVNTSRGQLVNSADLARALNENRIAGAGIDVLSVEPPIQGNPLLTARNCVVTPHLSWATAAARKRLMNVAVKNIKSFLDGKALNIVN
jgi:glycerate dehydrogenase